MMQCWASILSGVGAHFCYQEVVTPFAGFADFAACIAANGDKDDPKAYCGALEAQAAKLAKEHTHYGIVKTNDAERLVFGWASVSQGPDGSLLEDLQGDVIEPAELEKAVYDFVLYGGGANEMHQGRMKGQVIESFMVTPEKLTAMKLTSNGAPTAGWWVGFKLEPDAYEKVRTRQYKMFSIKGHSEAEEVAA